MNEVSPDERSNRIGEVSYWHIPLTDLLSLLQAKPAGLTSQEAKKRLTSAGRDRSPSRHQFTAGRLLLAQFESPVILILLFAAGLSFYLHSHTDTLIIVSIVLASGLLGFWQEYSANNAVALLLSVVQVKALVRRDGEPKLIAADNVVPGDVIIVSAGTRVSGDCVLLESNDLYVNEANLTGETYPVAKTSGVLPEDTALSHRSNTIFMGTTIVSGSATAVIVHTSSNSELGKVSKHLEYKRPETEFERGVRQFGYLLLEVTLILVLGIFAINVYLHRPVLDSFLFALALAVGLTPQLLPAIISINLAHGAKNMAAQKVIVKRLVAIENFGSMNVLCSDKTGTLTEGHITLQDSVDIEGKSNEKVFLYAYLNSSFESGYTNPIDQAILDAKHIDVSGYHKLDEVPYDFIRKRLSVLVATDDHYLMITKGALPSILDVCATAETSQGSVDLTTVSPCIQKRFEEFSRQGFRVLGLAYRALGSTQNTLPSIEKGDERTMTFLGFLVLTDRPKQAAAKTVRDLHSLGITLKIVTGDNKLVAAHVAQEVGLERTAILTGTELTRLSDDALQHCVEHIDIFAEIEPNQKERIILALRKAGNVVGYLGDGINDASALHAADIGISVDSAADVAKEAAEIVLLEKDLGVLVQGVREGRITFANTLKYVFMATSANFGNMFSMAGASLFLPFLPMLPKQILLTNLLTDLPEMTIATDTVDAELIERPRRWDIGFIRRFMLIFGALSSVFDCLTFGVLRYILHAGPIEFRTGWFIESVVSASLIVLVIRTRRPLYSSVPGKHLLLATLGSAVLTLLIIISPVAALLGFGAIPLNFFIVVALIVGIYITFAEVTKYFFYRYTIW